MSNDDREEFALISVTIARGAASPAHTHPGDWVGDQFRNTGDKRVHLVTTIL